MVGTPVKLADGSEIPVQNVEVGMDVLSFNPLEDAFFNATVTSVVAKSVDNLHLIKTDLGSNFRVDSMEMFWVTIPDGTRLWRNAGQLNLGDRIFRPLEGSWSTVTEVKIITGQFTVYDVLFTPTLGDALMPLIADGYLDAKIP